MSEVVWRQKSAAAVKEDGADVSTPPVIRELKNYHPFATTRAFRESRIRRDSFRAEHRSVGVFTSGGDASGRNDFHCYRSHVVLYVPKQVVT